LGALHEVRYHGIQVPENENTGSQDDSKSGPFEPLIGQKAQGCWLGYGSVLFLEFGEPQPLNDLRKHPPGEWGLSCDKILWRIEQGDRVLAGSEDDRPIMRSAIEQIDGRILVSGEISQSTGDSLLEFTDHLVLKTFVTTSEEDARWWLRHRYLRCTGAGVSAGLGRERSGSMTSRDAETLEEFSRVLWGAHFAD
jgi:hypothetical protein